jgi:hypothetical protein
MSEPTVQSYQRHARYHPPFHFVLIPGSLLLLIGLCIHLYKSPGKTNAVLVAWMALWILHLFLTRIYALRVQDRVIRLEERLRLATLLPEGLRGRIGELSLDQLIGLRFASDAELPALAERALKEKLSKDEIKKAVQQWRADEWRV